MSVRTEPATPSLFRFVLQRDEVSRFPGYATNAVVNDEFLDGANMSHLRGRYGNEDPDWIFDERDFEDGKTWGVVRSDEVQTAELQTSATVTVTAIDYGAAGKLRGVRQGPLWRLAASPDRRGRAVARRARAAVRRRRQSHRRRAA